MALDFLYPRGECCEPNPEYRQDTLELLQRRRYPGGQSIVDPLHKDAFKNPVLRNHLRVGSAKRRVTWLD